MCVCEGGARWREGERTVVVAGLGLEGAERLDLRHAAARVVRVTGALLHGLLGQARVQIHDFSWWEGGAAANFSI